MKIDTRLGAAQPVSQRHAQPVGFIDDVLRHSFWPAKEFFYDLLQVPLRRVLETPPRPSVRRLMWGDGLLTQPGVPAAPREEPDWIAQYNGLGDGMRTVLANYVERDCLYICYEASPGLLAYLDERSVTYVDVRISPLRFMADVVVALRSNDAGINAVLAQASMTQGDIESEAMLLAASWRHLDRYVRPPHAQDEPGPVYFVGQTATDASIVVGQSYFRVENALPFLSDALGDRDVVYLRHPSSDAAHVHRETTALASVSRTLSVSGENSYDLLCAERPCAFLGISSGLLQEARFFGKEAFSMLPPVCPLYFPEEPESSETGYFQLSFDTFMSDGLWSALLGRLPVIPRETPRTMRPNQLRELHNVWWGYAAHKAKPTDFTRAANRDVQAEVSTLQGTVNFLFSLVSEAPGAAGAGGIFGRCWRWMDDSAVTFEADGTVIKAGVPSGTWRGVAGRPGTAMAMWATGGWIDLVELNPDGESLHCRNNTGHQFTVSAM